MKVVLIGCGGIGLKHLRALADVSKGLSINLYLLDYNKGSASNAKQDCEKLFDAVNLIDDIEDIYKINPERIILATPVNARDCLIPLLKSTASLILVEKPFVLTSDNKFFQNYGEILPFIDRILVAYPRRFGEIYIRVKQLLIEEGRPIFYEHRFLQNYKYYREDYKTSYYADLTSGGGAFNDALPHCYNILQFLAPGMVVGERANSFAYTKLDGSGVDQNVLSTVVGEDFFASLQVSQVYHGNVDSVAIACENKSFLADRIAQTLTIMGDEQVEIIEYPSDSFSEMLRRQMLSFIQGEWSEQWTSVQDELERVTACLAITRF